MRTLRFNVEGQVITQDPDCDFSNLVPGTKDYVRVTFSFSNEWRGYKRVASFWSMLGKEYMPQELDFGCSCMVPAEALTKRAFKVQVIGINNGMKITTNKVVVKQNGGKV